MEKDNSFWLKSFKVNNFEKLKKDVKADVCIVGGGLTGLTTAYYLAKQRYKVVLIEKDTILSKTSGHTTAKITSQHGLFYDYLINSKGEDFARKYLEGNEKAKENIKGIINAEKIHCDFERKSAYVFTEKESEVQKIKDEVKAVKSLNVVDCDFVEKLPLNLDIKGAIEFKNQAQFNPVKYANELARCITENGGLIFENTRFDDYSKEGDTFTIHTDTKSSITSKYLVIATRYPIINFPGYYFLKMYQEMSYCIAIKPKQKIDINGMYINAEVPTLSIKTAKYNGEDIVFVSGYNNKTGEMEKAGISKEEAYSKEKGLMQKYENLKERAYKIFGDYEFLCEWDTEDCIGLDKIAYIGEFSNLTNNLFVATGFKKWGMTTSNLAGNIIADKIIGRDNKYAEIFKATRLEPIKNNDELDNMIKQSVKSLIVDKLKKPNEILDDVQNDEGKIVMFGDEKVGVYKDKSGNVYAVKPVCTHLGCELSWNNLNKTWDCPCHGSRFDYTGKNIDSPSIKNLENYNFE